MFLYYSLSFTWSWHGFINIRLYWDVFKLFLPKHNLCIHGSRYYIFGCNKRYDILGQIGCLSSWFSCTHIDINDHSFIIVLLRYFFLLLRYIFFIIIKIFLFSVLYRHLFWRVIINLNLNGNYDTTKNICTSCFTCYKV